MKTFDDLILKYPSLSEASESITEVFNILLCSVKNGGKIMICGNGGSASDSEHIVGELMKEFYRKRPVDDQTAGMLRKTDAFPDELISSLQGAIPAISLNSQTSLITAISNDVDPAMIFAQQVYGYGKEGDALIALSTSGNSENVFNAVRVAKAMKIRTVLITGQNGGKIKNIVDTAICLPESETYKIQELTLPVYHAICMQLESSLFA